MKQFDTTVYIDWYKQKNIKTQTEITRQMAISCLGYIDDDGYVFITCVPEIFPWDYKNIIHEYEYDRYEKDIFDLLNDDIQNEIYRQIELYGLPSKDGQDAMDATREEAAQMREEIK